MTLAAVVAALSTAAPAAGRPEAGAQSARGPKAPGVLLTREVGTVRKPRSGFALRTASGRRVRRIPIARSFVRRHVFAAEGGTLSPDGRRIAFLASRRGSTGRGLFAIGTRGGRVTELVAPRQALDSASVRWSRDSRWIAVERFGSRGTLAVEPAARPPRVLPVDAGVAGAPEFTPDGRALLREVKVAVPGNSNANQLEAVPIEGGAPTPITPPMDPQPLEPRFSPDGSRIAFSASAPGGDDGADIFVAPVGQPPQRVFSFAGLEPGEVSWSPDGRKLALRLLQDSGDLLLGRLAVLDLTTGRATSFATLDSISTDRLEWSPDSRFVAFTQPPRRIGDRTAVTIVQADGTRVYERAFRDADAPQWLARRPR